MFKRLLLTLIVALAPAALVADDLDTTLFIPITGTTAGALGSQWQGELTLHNASSDPVTFVVTLWESSGDVTGGEVTVAPRSTRAFANLALDFFGKTDAIGALTIRVPETAVGRVAVTSRVANHTANGLLGQDVPAIEGSEALRSGATGVLVGPRDASSSRFNFGVFALQETEIEWRLIRADGTVAQTRTETYDAGRHVQYVGGIENFLGATPADDDVVYARILTGRAFVFGSIVDNGTGDPTFVPGIEVREGFAIELLGVDKDGDGVADIVDADRDGVLDAPVVVGTGPFPDGFRILVSPGETGSVTLTMLEAPFDADFIDANGMVMIFPPLGATGQSRLVVRATDGFRVADFIIPIVFN